MGRIFDAINGVVGDAAAHREATRFARQVRVGDVWYSVERHTMPWGDVSLLHEHHFTKIDKLISGQPMCGHRTAAAVWLAHGPLYKSRPPGMQTLDEYSDSGSWELDGATEEVVKRVKAQLLKDLAKPGR
ncbi:hypothetical protein ABZ545_01410 [Streptomyces abikoensis]|uniref:hypothetical protein n=1 Tax=Streptomyces abikoensis TaxID=97398 RepID=UPI0033E88BF7